MKKSQIALGILSSIALGAVLGILFAQDKGVNTRSKISKKGRDIKNNIKDSIENLTSTVNEKANTLTSKAAKEVNKRKSNLKNVKKVNK